MNKLTSEQIAQATQETPRPITAMRVRQMANRGEIKGIKIGNLWLFSPSVINVINSRKERRGRKPNHLAKKNGAK